ncbi:MAG TPA: HAD family hydrolase [Bryobacteraceae bacterium]|nr:HAD family hydrolase [Bryobacteraceae bacterium]
MRFVALATDFDGTLAHDGIVSTNTLAALERLKASGRRLLLVTGRELGDLQSIFPRLDLFDLAVMENGGTLYFPAARREQALADAPASSFVEACRERGVARLSVGRVVVATWQTEVSKILDAIHEIGLELQVIFNKGSVMVLPPGVNKASGLAAALNHLCLSPHNVVGIGDAENDHAFLTSCECSAAVANALPALKARADIVTKGDHGDGVVELIDALIRDDLAGAGASLCRHDILLGRSGEGNQVSFPVYGRNLLIAGSSGGGKSSITSSFVERLLEAHYQVCVIDPEGDYKELGDAVVLGEPKSPPTVEAALTVLEKPERSAVLNLVGLRFEDRPAFFQRLLPRLQELTIRSGRPHWTIVDEAHHMLPVDGTLPTLLPGKGFMNLALITVRPEHVARDGVALTDALIAVGSEPDVTAQAWSAATGIPATPVKTRLNRGHAVLWRREQAGRPVLFEVTESQTDRQRHSRKYASGELPPERSFFFRGPDGKLKLRADNLTTFLRMAEGVDDDTWQHHLRQGDYSRWVRTEIHNDELAAETEAVERDQSLSADQSRAKIREAIAKRFTIPE